MNTTTIRVYRDLMGANDAWAAKTRDLLAANQVMMLNMIGSPGCGKTALLEYSIRHLREHCRVAVLEGDCETTNDAQRLQPLGIPVSQLLTGGGCHLEAKLVHHALLDLPLADLDLVVVENVGNLVCPAEFDIGEHAKIAVLSITEGEDKPEKYPVLFRDAGASVLTKLDLLPYVPFKLDVCRRHLTNLNGVTPIFEVAALRDGAESDWLSWLKSLVLPATPLTECGKISH